MLSKPIILHNFRRSFDINENYILNETSNNNFRMTPIPPKNRIDERLFSKMLPKSAKTSKDAEKRLSTWQGGPMFIHYQYHLVAPKGSNPDGLKYRINQSQYWLGEPQLKYLGKSGQSVDVTLLRITDVTDENNEKLIGYTYVSTYTFLAEVERALELIKFVA